MSEPLTDVALNAIEARAMAATPPPWEPPWRWVAGVLMGVSHGQWLELDIGGADGLFLTHAREDVPRLVAEVRRLRAALAVYADTDHWIVFDRNPETSAPGKEWWCCQWLGPGEETQDGATVARAALEGKAHEAAPTG